MSIFGLEPGNVISSIGNAFAALMPKQAQPRQQFQPGMGVAGAGFQAPVVTLGGGVQPGMAPSQGFMAAPTSGYNMGFQAAPTPLAQGFMASLGSGYQGFQPAPPIGAADFGSPFAYSDKNAQNAREREAEAAKYTTQKSGTKTSSSSGNWAGPATADDNKGITAAKVEEVIAATRANSPMRGKGQMILDYANQRGVSVPEIMGIFLAESELGTTAGPTWNVAGLGGVGNFQGYANIDDAIKAAIDNLATDIYRGKSLQEQIGTWFVGPQGWAQGGVNASDGVNGTVGQYIAGKVAPMYAAFGVPLNQTGAATKVAPQGGGAGMNAITGGQAFPIMQEYGDTDYSDAHPDTYAYAAAYGGHGHTGIDWAAPIGTQVYTPVGGTVSVVGNDHGSGYYFTNTMTQSDRDHSGEFAITLDNGDILILGHMSNISALVGQHLDAGSLVGLSGGSDGAHVHVEYRRKNANGGYTLVDPRSVLGG